jgi:hypothetical protein
VLEKIFSEFGYTLKGHTFTKNKEILSLIILSNYSLDLIESYSSCYISQLFVQSIGLDGAVIHFNNDSLYDCHDLRDSHNTSTYLTTIQEQGRYRFNLDIKASVTYDQPIPIVYNNANPVVHFVLYENNNPIHELFEVIQTDSDVYGNYSFEYEHIFFKESVGNLMHFKVFYTIGDQEMRTIGKLKDGFLLIQNLDANVRNRYVDTIYYNNHLPDISIKSFISTIEKITCSTFMFNDSDRTVTINFWDDILADVNQSSDLGKIIKDTLSIDYSSINTGFNLGYSSVSDIEISNYNQLPSTNIKPVGTGDFEINDVIFCTPLNAFYIYRIPANAEDQIPEWEFFLQNIPDSTFTDDDTNVLDIDIDCSIPKMDYSPMPYLVPVIDESGFSDSFPNEGTALDLTLCFYRGFINNQYQDNYPLATPYNILANGNTFANYSLTPKGLASTIYKKYIAWILTRYPIELKSYLTLSFLQSLSYTDKINLNGMIYLIDSIEVSMELQHLTEATIKLYSV